MWNIQAFHHSIQVMLGIYLRVLKLYEPKML